MFVIPLEIDARETIVRGILTPVHIYQKGTKKGKLKPQVFQSPTGKDEVSTIRHKYMGNDFCKQKAKEIASANSNQYHGLAIILVKNIRLVGSDVIDSREPPNFLGHADVKHGFLLVPPNEPLFATERLRQLEHIQRLVALARYYPDPNPDSYNWTGPELLAERD